MPDECRDFPDGLYNFFRCNHSGAFEMLRSSFPAGTAQVVRNIEFYPHVIPAAVADMFVDDPVRSRKFIARMSKTADQNYIFPAAPCQPAQAAGKTDKEIGMGNQIDTLLQGQIPGKIFSPARDVIPDQAISGNSIFVNADHPISIVSQKLYYRNPAKRIIPVFGL